VIEVEGLTKRYGPIAAIDGVTFSVAQGEVIGFLGPNGAGKTTTMRILTGFSPPTRGTARVAGFDVLAEPLEVKRRVGYLPETVPLYPEMVVSKFLAYVAEIKGIARSRRRAEVGRVIERCGVGPVATRLVRNVSKGFRQRIGLAQALIGSPPVLILDEPTVGLDPQQIVEIREMIRCLAQEHTVLLSTHILPEVTMVCGRVLIIRRGRIVAQDTMANLAGAGRPRAFTVEADGPAEPLLGALRAVPGVAFAEAERAGRFRLKALVGADIAPGVAEAVIGAGGRLRMLAECTRTLEDVFMDVIASDAGGER